MGKRRRGRSAVLALVAVSCLAVVPRGGLAQATQQELDALQDEIRRLRAQQAETARQLERIEQRIEQLQSGPAAGAPAAPPPAGAEQRRQAEAQPAPTPSGQEEMERRVTEKVMRDIQPSLAAANKTFPSQFNPAISLAIDMVGAYGTQTGGNFDFRSAEIGLSASVDPFVRGYAFFNGTSDGVSVEEAALVTTSLPYNLAVKGGRFFADFGRLSKFHDHDLPFVNRPIVLDEYVNGESQADGLELSYLLPLPQYLTLTAGWYNKIGSDNERVSNLVPRQLSQFTYLVHPATFISLNDANSIDLGASYAYTPRVDDYSIDSTVVGGNGKNRQLAGIDLTYRFTPLATAAYRGLVWGTEVLYNQQDYTTNLQDPEMPIFRSTNAVGLYSYLEPRLTRRYYLGFLFQWVQAIDRLAGDTLAYSPYLTIWVSEFQRIRLQYQYLDSPGLHENQFFLQWTGILGSHAHTFRDR